MVHKVIVVWLTDLVAIANNLKIFLHFSVILICFQSKVFLTLICFVFVSIYCVLLNKGRLYFVNQLLSWNDLNYFYEVTTQRSSSQLKARLHIRFPHAFTALRCNFQVLMLDSWCLWKKVITSKMQRGNRMWQLDLSSDKLQSFSSQEGLSSKLENEKSSRDTRKERENFISFFFESWNLKCALTASMNYSMNRKCNHEVW